MLNTKYQLLHTKYLRAMHDFQQLRVWQDSIELAVETYQLTRQLPSEEKFGLVSQMNRASVSVASNIAEGAGRNTNGEFKQFLGIASGSCAELFTQAIIAERLGFAVPNQVEVLKRHTLAIRNMISRLQQTL